ncbi:MAG TPA: hypothetical protein ENH19_02415 [Actinobacteria bacterium]|nr:hypothetical protein [Actinomycetes bacterium]HEX21492.1 hypothetical protein [Actinomycetota bacterium]
MKNLNFFLILATVIILTAIGISFFVGTVYSSTQAPNWTGTPLYQTYLDKMNVAVLPFAVALIVVLGICIPKRLFKDADLLKVNGLLLGITFLIAITIDAKTGIGFLFIAAALIQLVVIALTFVGSKRLSFERTGFFLQLGSALLHLGLVIFFFDFLLLADNPDHLTVFWVATLLIGLGMLFSFYSQELNHIGHREA